MNSVSRVAACMWILGVGVAGCGDVSVKDPASPATPLAQDSTTVPREQQASGLVPYEVLARDSFGTAKVSYSILVELVDGRLPRDKELAAISNSLRARERQYDNMFVEFYLPGMPIQGRAFAVAHHMPHPQEVKVFTEALPKEYYSLLDLGSDSPRPPTRCDSISKMIRLVRDYSEEDGTFRMLDNSPTPHFQISPIFVQGDLEEVVKETMERDLVYAIFSTFIHTDYDAVRVTVVPAVLTDFKARKKTFTPSKSITLVVSGADALSVLRKHAEVESFDDLCGVPIEGTYSPDLPTEIFNRCMYNDQGPPTLDLIFSELSAASEAKSTTH